MPSDGIVESLAKVLLGEHIVQEALLRSRRRSFGDHFWQKSRNRGANLHGNTDSGYGARESNDCNDTTVAGLWHEYRASSLNE